MKINRLGVILALTILSGFLLALPWLPGRLAAGLLLLAFLPGYALLAALWPDADEAPAPAERFLLGVAASFTLTVLWLLALALARLPFTGLSVAAGLIGLALGFTLFAWRRATKSASPNDALRTTHYASMWLIAILLCAAFFRLTNVGYSDLQGDEADILFRAVELTYGRYETIFTHSKGPGEILLLDAVGLMSGQFDEATARLPFSLAGAVAVGLIFWLGYRLFSLPVGVIAGLLAGLDGAFVSYARTAQYQSLVLLLTLAALTCFYQATRSDRPRRRWVSLGSLLLAGAFLFHFEVILLLPVVLYLTLAPLIYRQPSPLRFTFYVLHLWPAALIFLLPVAAFYLPFLLHPNVGNTGSYLEGRISSGELPPFNNLGHFFYDEALKYNAAYYAALVALALSGLALAALWRSMQAGPLFRWAGVICLVGVGLGGGLALAGLVKPAAWLLALGFGLFFGLVILSPRTTLAERLLWLWIASPFWIYVFWVNRPGKHHYLFLAALMLLVGLAVTGGWRWLVGRWPGLAQPVGRGVAGLVGLGLLLLFAGHTVMVLMRSDLEYILTYPAHKSALYPTDSAFPYDTRIGFGYPFRLGWQTVGHLKRTGQLAGTWAGNDAGNAPDWYMLNTADTPCYPDFVLRGEITYKGDDSFGVPFIPDEFGYRPRYEIWGNDRRRMTILAFDPLGEWGEPIRLTEGDNFAPLVTAADFAASFGPSETPPPAIRLEPAPVLGEGSELKNNAPPEYKARAESLAGRVALLGYDLDVRYQRPGAILPITLHWQTQSLLSLRYKVFVHLVSAEGQLWAQADDFPVCGTSHANSWPPGQVTPDRHLLKLPPEMPPGDYTLRVGMYEPDLNLRLNYFDIAGNEQGNSLTVGTVSLTAN